MAHWDLERDRKKAETIKKCPSLMRDPKAVKVLRKFERTGDPIYWEKILEIMREIAAKPKP